MIAGGPGAQNPELLAPFIDLFVIGDGEPSLPVVCDLWKSMQGSDLSRAEKLQRIAGSVEWAYVPRFYEPIYGEDGTIVEIRRTRDDVPEAIKPCVIRDLDSIPLPPGRLSRSSRRRTTGSPSKSCAGARGCAVSARAR